MAYKRSVVIFGAGAVGGYLGSRLDEALRNEWDLTLVGRPSLQDAVRRHGLQRRSEAGHTVTHPHVVVSARELGSCDLVILCVRAYDVQAALADVRRLIGDAGVVLAMQNGVGTEEVVADALGRSRIIPGTTTIRTEIEGPGIVGSYSERGGVALSGMTNAAVPAWILDGFRRAGLATVEIADYRSLRWSKLLLNMLGAATSSILDVDMSVIAHDPSLFRIEQRAFREATRVMDRERIPTTSLPGYPVPLVRGIMRMRRSLAQQMLAPRLANARGGRSPTMRADVKRGRTEVPWLNGAIAAHGDRRELRTPINHALAALVEELAANPGERARYAGRPDRLLHYLSANRIRL